MELRLDHKALHDLEAAGAQAWLVGGCVRDALLGKSFKDIDIACNFPWEASEQALSHAGWQCMRTGVKHGTLTAQWQESATSPYTLPAEITTFRTEGSYSDFRHPDEVALASSIEEDLARRDFTINALAYHPERGMVDVYGGQKDLQNKVLRCVGKPLERFREDPLRIVRGCRFASQLGFSIEAETFSAMLECKGLLGKVSNERIYKELTLMLCGQFVHDALMQCAPVLFELIPELQDTWKFPQHSPYHCYDVYEHSAWVVAYSPATPLARWAALLHDCAKPACARVDALGFYHFKRHAHFSAVIAEATMSRFPMTNSMKAQLKTLVQLHDVAMYPNAALIKNYIHHLGDNPALFQALCELQLADNSAKSKDIAKRGDCIPEVLALLEHILATGQVYSLKQLCINGNDLITWGIPAGKRIATLQNEVLRRVIKGELPNEKQAVYNYLFGTDSGVRL